MLHFSWAIDFASFNCFSASFCASEIIIIINICFIALMMGSRIKGS